ESMIHVSQLIIPLRNMILPKKNSQMQTMHLLELPHDVLRELMKLMSINDCMRLRRTCRAFEKLVAATHTSFGHAVISIEEIQVFEEQKNTSLKKSVAVVNLDQDRFKIDFTEFGYEQFGRLMNRMFGGILIRECTISLRHECMHIDFVLQLARLFKINLLTFLVYSDRLLQKV
ncbi:hypothetical protein PMAYCL1PPCAC_22357, partial [Pristionchus mayeri]